MKKIVILYNLNRNQNEYEAEFDSELTIDSIYNCIKNNYEVKKIEASKSFDWIHDLQSFNPDLVFNICEGYNGPARESVYAAILEQFNINYSGPDSTNLLICHNKFVVKQLVNNVVNVPIGYCIHSPKELDNIKSISYPLFVKLNSEGSSIGLSEKSIVNNHKELVDQVNWLYNKYKRNILIEEFIDGIDISMIFIEGIGALGPCIIKCGSLFYDYEMKTVKDDTVNIEPFEIDNNVIKSIVERIAKTLDIKGYAKMDFRISNNKLFLIEVNSQVSFHPNGEFMTCAKRDNYTYEQIINYIVETSLKEEYKQNSIGFLLKENENE